MSGTHKCTGCGALGAFWYPLPGGRRAAIRGTVTARCERCGGERKWVSGAASGTVHGSGPGGEATVGPVDERPADRLVKRGDG